MAKLKNSSAGQGSRKQPALGADSRLVASLSRSSLSRDRSLRILSQTSATPLPKALNFGALHTKSASSTTQAGINWTSLLKSASGSGSGLLGGGLLSAGGVGFIAKLFSLFGGGKAATPVPTQFQSPVPQQNSLNITTPGAAASVSLGVHPLATVHSSAGVYSHSTGVSADAGAQSLHVIQIVKQALLTSSSLNDVISEI